MTAQEGRTTNCTKAGFVRLNLFRRTSTRSAICCAPHLLCTSFVVHLICRAPAQEFGIFTNLTIYIYWSMLINKRMNYGY